MAALSKLKAGQTVYSIVRTRMGNTTVRIGRLYTLKITEVNVAEKYVMASFNLNPVSKYYERSYKKWKVNRPKPKHKIFGEDGY